MLGAGIKEGKYAFIVTEIIDNGSLHDMIFEKTRPYCFEEVYTWALDTAKGMRYLHKMVIIHRDLKSLNLLITRDLRCKVTDYGASRLIDAGATMTGNIGTAAWMAPEGQSVIFFAHCCPFLVLERYFFSFALWVMLFFV